MYLKKQSSNKSEKDYIIEYVLLSHSGEIAVLCHLTFVLLSITIKEKTTGVSLR